MHSPLSEPKWLFSTHQNGEGETAMEQYSIHSQSSSPEAYDTSILLYSFLINQILTYIKDSDMVCFLLYYSLY